MPATPEEITRREVAARNAIMKAFGTVDDEYGATLFVSHHLKELPTSYWASFIGDAGTEVLDLLTLRSHWGGDGGIDTFDFTIEA